MPDVSKGKPKEEVDPHEADTRPTTPADLLQPDPWTRLNIMEDVNGTSIVPTVDQLISSHIHKASGAVRALKKDVIIWTDFDYKKIKQSYGVVKLTVPWEYPDGEVSGSYTFLNVATSPVLQYWGVAPAMGKIEFKGDTMMRQLGCYFGTMPNPFMQEDRETWPGTNATVQYMAMSHERVMQEPWQSNLDRHCQL